MNQLGEGVKTPDMCAMREISIGEMLDRRIDKAEMLLRTLHDLKGNLSANFLKCGAGRISALIEVQ